MLQEHVTKSKVSDVLSMSKSSGEHIKSSSQNNETVGAAVTKSGRVFHARTDMAGNPVSDDVSPG